MDSLATTGGHILALLFLIVLGSFLMYFGETRGLVGMEKVGEASVLGPAVGALMMLYKSSGTNAEQLARAGSPYQPPQPPASALQPPIVVAEPPLPPSSTTEETHV